MRIINCGLMLGILAASSGQARADDNVTTEIQSLKAKLKELQQRVDSEARKTRQVEAQAKAVQLPASYKALAADPCAAGKVCYKGVTLTFGGWVDLTGIYRSRNLASDTGSVYNFIPYQQSRNFNIPETRFSARQSRFSVLAEGNADRRHASCRLRRDRFRRCGSDGELGCDQLIQSAHAAAQPGTGSQRSRSSFPRRAILVAERADQVGHRSSRRRCARRDRLRIRSGISRGTTARTARLAGHRTGVQAGCVGRECPDGVLRRQRPGGRHARRRTAGRAEPEPSGQSDRSRRQLLQQPQQCQPEPGARRHGEGGVGPAAWALPSCMSRRGRSTASCSTASTTPTTPTTPEASAATSTPSSIPKTLDLQLYGCARRARPLHGNAVPRRGGGAGRHHPSR